MCGPALGLIGTAVSVFGSLQSGVAQAASLQAQAAFNRRQASMEYVKGSYEIALQKRREQRIVGSQRSILASDGLAVDSTGAQDLYTATSQEAEMDRQAIRFGRDLTVSNYNYKAKIDSMNASQAQIGSIFSAVSTGIGGLTKLSDQYPSMFRMA